MHRMFYFKVQVFQFYSSKIYVQTPRLTCTSQTHMTKLILEEEHWQSFQFYTY